MNKEAKLIMVDPELWRLVKSKAALKDKSLSDVMEAALILWLDGDKNAEK